MRGNAEGARPFCGRNDREERAMGKGILLWLVGVPIPVILLLWFLFFRG